MLSMLFLICFYKHQYAQLNLVLNPSFEQLDSCPSGNSQIDKCKFWKSTNASYYCTTQLNNTCCLNPVACGVPSYYLGAGVFDYQWPRTGKGFCVIHNFSPPPPNTYYRNHRYYTTGILSNVLINGKQYCGKLYVNLSNDSPYKINQFGLYLDDGTVLTSQTTCSTVINVIPQVANNPAVFLDDTLGWMRIEGIFTANGTESRVTFGNFKDDASTIGIPTGFLTSFIPAYYNIDDISLIPLDIKAWAGNDATICLSDTLSLGRPQEVGLECMWYTPSSSVPFSTTSNFAFKPTETGVYTFIQKMDNCQISFDTVTVTVIDDCNSLLNIPNVFTPNGDGVNEVFKFELKNATLKDFTVYDRWGLQMYRFPEALEGNLYIKWDGRTTSGVECTAGVYFYVLEYTDVNGGNHKKNGYVTLIK